jgi:hypothetical protein
VRTFTSRMILAILLTGVTCILPGRLPSLLGVRQTSAQAPTHCLALVRGRTRSQSPSLPTRVREAVGLSERRPEPPSEAKVSRSLDRPNLMTCLSLPTPPYRPRSLISLRC